jgi:hypothetical protein
VACLHIYRIRMVDRARRSLVHQTDGEYKEIYIFVYIESRLGASSAEAE